MNLPTLRIGDLIAKVPIIQGGMGVGVSLAHLASAVANAGGIGVISAVQIGFREADFVTDNDNANLRALRKEIRKARSLSPTGILAINIMVAVQNYKDMVQVAVEEGIDLIISGAGLPVHLPPLVKGSKTKIAPIVSSGKAASIITRAWIRKYEYVPDLMIVEGALAGGHLGFSMSDLNDNNTSSLIDIVKDVIHVLKPYEEKYNQDIPVVAAGGIFDGKDIAHCLTAGAAGVQMSTRFVTTEQCDAHINFKQAYLNATLEDIKIIKSPVGMPGRALNNKFVKAMEANNQTITRCYQCLKICNPKTTPYCISDALIRSVTGDTERGLIFVGHNAFRNKAIVSVEELMKELVQETRQHLKS